MQVHERKVCYEVMYQNFLMLGPYVTRTPVSEPKTISSWHKNDLFWGTPLILAGPEVPDMSNSIESGIDIDFFRGIDIGIDIDFSEIRKLTLILTLIFRFLEH